MLQFNTHSFALKFLNIKKTEKKGNRKIRRVESLLRLNACLTFNPYPANVENMVIS